MTAISDNLIHFLARRHRDAPQRQFDIFKKIMKEGLRTSSVRTKFDVGQSVVNRAICFTDIPLSECDEHIAIYGKFGIGFKKSFVKQHGGNPARYFINYAPSEKTPYMEPEVRGVVGYMLSKHLKFVLVIQKALDAGADLSISDAEGETLITKEDLKVWTREQINLLSYSKETADLGPAGEDNPHTDVFYKEHEWRLVPPLLNDIPDTIVFEDIQVRYEFNRSDVNVIVTPNEDTRAQVNKFFANASADKIIDEEFGSNPPPIICYDHLKLW